jgi:hypothetical protein
MNLYVVIYGPDYEDIAFFSDLDKALYKLKVQFEGAIKNKAQFVPFMEEYVESDGVYKRTKHTPQ